MPEGKGVMGCARAFLVLVHRLWCMNKRVTMKDIAKAAGVTTATVSYALRGFQRISDETRARVAETARRLGYRPDAKLTEMMRYLRRDEKNEITGAIAALDLTGQADGLSREGGYSSAVFTHARAYAETLGYHLEAHPAEPSQDSLLKVTQVLRNRGIHGVLIPHFPPGLDELPIDWAGFVPVCVSYPGLASPFDHVSHHHFQGMQLALREAAMRGYRRPGFACSKARSELALRMWLGGLDDAARDGQMEPVTPLFGGDSSPRELLDWYGREQPDVVLGVGGTPKQHLEDAGLRIPEDCGYINLSWHSRHPEISGVDQRTELVAQAAVNLLTGALQRNSYGLPEGPRHVMIEGVWHEGASLRSSVAIDAPAV